MPLWIPQALAIFVSSDEVNYIGLLKLQDFTTTDEVDVYVCMYVCMREFITR